MSFATTKASTGEMSRWCRYLNATREYICGRRRAYQVREGFGVGPRLLNLGIQYLSDAALHRDSADPFRDDEEWDNEEMKSIHPDGSEWYGVKSFDSWEEAVEWARCSP